MTLNDTRSSNQPFVRYEPALDGLRAISVIAVIIYHAGFTWLGGGFLGVEVFFVVSGFLITSLLIGEHRSQGSINLREFWIRRARRLLPALVAMLAVIGLWVIFFGHQHVAAFRHDALPGIFYFSNWWQIFASDIPYFGLANPPLLRHLWSLAVEEQWYLIWPVVAISLIKRTSSAHLRRRMAYSLTAVALIIWFVTALASFGADEDRVNFLYLSTVTRFGGLLIGAAAAFWVASHPRGFPIPQWPGRLVLPAFALLLLSFIPFHVDSLLVYRGGLALVAVFSALIVLEVTLNPRSQLRGLLSMTWLVAIGKRSYGLYLWHWPMFVAFGVRQDRVRVWPALLVSILLSECCLRFVEQPMRSGWLGRQWRILYRPKLRRPLRIFCVLSVIIFLPTTALVVGLLRTPAPIAGQGGAVVDFDESVLTATTVLDNSSTVPSEQIPDDGSSESTTSSVPFVMPPLPRKLLVVGDSQGHSLVINHPEDLDKYFTLVKKTSSGCGLFEDGRVITQQPKFGWSFVDCGPPVQRWENAARVNQPDVTLLVTGAWDVFDIELDSVTYVFATPEFDRKWIANLQTGIDAIVAQGSAMALLEVPCMRPIDAATPVLPERAMDDRVAHLNDLLRQVATTNVATTTFIEGPDGWCADEKIATDLSLRYDGLHVYRQGANYIFETISPALLRVPSLR